MHFLSFALKDRGVIDADLRFISAFILEQFSAENKAIKEEVCKSENRGDDGGCNGYVSLYVDNQSLSYCQIKLD